MFETIDEQVEETEGRPTARSRMLYFVGIAAVLVVFVGGLYFAIASFE